MRAVGRPGSTLPLLLLLAALARASLEDECAHCRFLVKTFKEGLERTESLHFGGGNTDWEERKLGKFKQSETRFVESMEYACRKGKGDMDSKDLLFKCHSMAEEHEEVLERWFFERQEEHPDLELFLCVKELRKCCPSGHFGKHCEPCPGYAEGEASVCFGNGRCDGDGTRRGEGKCDCRAGYVGKMCSNCDANYYALAQNASGIECAECFEGCAGGCTGEGPAGCRTCRTGYRMTEGGCEDVDECAEAIAEDASPKCPAANEACVNTPGSFRCECLPGYGRVDGRCELDIQGPPEDDASAEEEEGNAQAPAEPEASEEAPAEPEASGEGAPGSLSPELLPPAKLDEL